MTEIQEERLRAVCRRLDGGNISEALGECLALREETRGDARGWKVLEVLAELYKLSGDAEGAACALWQAAQEDEYLREQRRHYSGYLFALHYLEGINREDMFAAHRQYGELFRETEPLPPRRWDGHGRLRVGYLAPSWAESSVMRFVEPFLTELPSERFEVRAYSLGPEEPGSFVMESPARYASLAGLDNWEAAERIRSDEIDVLVDFGGHSAGGRTLFLLAQRPAPVQLAGIGYFDTLGLPEGCLDGFLADAALARPGEEKFFCEPWWSLPHALAFKPDAVLAAVRGHQAGRHLRTGGPVLGVWQNLLKVTDTALKAWREILLRLPESVLHIRDALPLRERAAAVRQRAESLGLPMERVRVEAGGEEFLPAYGSLDLVLDTFPYPGGYMTAAALYLGVPVVTLAGERYGSRMGASILQAAGRPEWIAESVEEYVELAVALGGGRSNLAEARRALREELPASPLLNTKAYMENVAAGFEQFLFDPVPGSRGTASGRSVRTRRG